MNHQHIVSVLALTASVMLVGCAGMSRQEVSTVTGAAVGAVVGSAVGGPIATVGGAVVGGVVGNEVGKK
ncbi:MAG: glycine zipper 2TM domain-containing protein [Rubrivivax sp.]|nr:glycine zipper 2TM domain-containing protein [Rubrivivax sp.]